MSTAKRSRRVESRTKATRGGYSKSAMTVPPRPSVLKWQCTLYSVYSYKKIKREVRNRETESPLSKHHNGGGSIDGHGDEDRTHTTNYTYLRAEWFAVGPADSA